MPSTFLGNPSQQAAEFIKSLRHQEVDFDTCAPKVQAGAAEVQLVKTTVAEGNKIITMNWTAQIDGQTLGIWKDFTMYESSLGILDGLYAGLWDFKIGDIDFTKRVQTLTVPEDSPWRPGEEITVTFTA